MTNPWQDPTGGTLEEFWALGFRSPHRLTLDAPTGTIWCGDAGQTTSEEVDIIQSGGNYQWSYMEGNVPGPSVKPNPIIGFDAPPIYAYPHFNGNGCVIGGYVYRGSQFAAQLGGQYIFGDYDSNRVWSMSYSGSGAGGELFGTVPGMNHALYQGGIPRSGGRERGGYICTDWGRLHPSTGWSPPGTPIPCELSARASVGHRLQCPHSGIRHRRSGNANILLRGIGPAMGADPFRCAGLPCPATDHDHKRDLIHEVATGTAWGRFRVRLAETMSNVGHSRFRRLRGRGAV